MSINAMWIQVSCDRCQTEIEVELETDPSKSGSWPHNTDRLYEHLERMGWAWTGGGLNQDICPTCLLGYLGMAPTNSGLTSRRNECMVGAGTPAEEA